MFHRPECRRYRQWKREEARKLLGSRKVEKVKRRHKQPVDCIDEEEEEHVTKAALKIKSRECKKKRKRSSNRGPKGLRVKQITKHVSLADLFLKCIKPSIEVRQQLLNPRHIACLHDTPSKMDIAAEIIEATRPSLPRHVCRTRFRRKKARRKRPVARKPKSVGEKAGQEEGKAEEKPDDEAPSGSKAQKRVKGKRRRRKVVRRKAWKKDSDDESDCDSICSFHSEVCLGVSPLKEADTRFGGDRYKWASNWTSDEACSGSWNADNRRYRNGHQVGCTSQHDTAVSVHWQLLLRTTTVILCKLVLVI